ncbi:MAG: ATP-binding protein [candidate division WOR-3 bacterium]
MNREHLGYCIGVLKPDEVIFTSVEPPSLGEFVVVESNEGDKTVRILGIVKGVERFDRFIGNDSYSPEVVESIINVHKSHGIFRSYVSILGMIDGNDLKNLRHPPKPASPVYRADKELLESIFSKGGSSHIPVGTLLTSGDVKVYVDLDQIASRHLAVLAITGGGKSNAVSVILEEIAKKRGTVIVVDVHGEYENAEYLDERGENVVHPIDVKINLSELSADEIATLCGIDFDRSGRQYFVLQKLVECVRRMREAKKIINIRNDVAKNGYVGGFDENNEDKSDNLPPFIDDLIKTLEVLIEYRSNKGKSEEEEYDLEGELGEIYEIIKLCSFVNYLKKDELIGVHIRLNNLRTKLRNRIDDNYQPLIEQIKHGYINVLRMKDLDYDAMDVILSHLLYQLLNERKKAIHGFESKIKVPVIVVIEEAHIFAPWDSTTRTKEALSKVAREARKFGLGIILVSQRPKGLDSNILSQMNNWIILRIVEPEDQRHIQRASETLSGDLLNYLSALNPGEAILLGPFVKIPLLVKFRKSQAKKSGSDISATEEWSKWKMNYYLK